MVKITRALLIVAVMLNHVLTFSQVIDNPGLGDRIRPIMDSIFMNLNPNHIPGKILINKAFVFSGIDNYDGINTNSKASISDLKQICLEIWNSAYDRTGLVTPDALENALGNDRTNGALPVGGLFFTYGQIDPNAESSGKLTFSNGAYHENATSGMYLSKNVLAMSPLVNTIDHSDATFLFDSNYLLTNKNITKLEFDPGDGNGYRVVTFGQSVACTYGSTGSKTLTFKITSGSSIYITKSTLQVTMLFNLNASATFKATGSTGTAYYFATSTTFVPASSISNIPNGQTLVTVTYANANVGQTLNNPIIFVEGVDFGKGNNGGKNGKLGFTSLLSGGGTDYPQLAQAPSMLNTIWNDGYDVAYVDFYDGADYMENNADVLVNIINNLNQLKTSSNENIVIGASMGGQVARFALGKMAQLGIPLCTREYISFDSPHQGANVPLGAQFMLNFVKSENQAAADAINNGLNRPV